MASENGEHFRRHYTDEQRDAIAAAYVDRGIRPARLICEMAEAGTLLEGLAPFTVRGGPQTVLALARKLREQRAGKAASELARRPPADAVEALRTRLISAIDFELRQVEARQARQAAKPLAKRQREDMEHLRQVGRALREAASLPTPTQGGKPTRSETGKTRPDESPVHRLGGIGGAIARDVAERGSGAAQEPQHVHPSEGGDVDASSLVADGGEGREEDAPGVFARRALGAASTPLIRTPEQAEQQGGKPREPSSSKT